MISMDVNYYQENIDKDFYGVSVVGRTECPNTIDGEPCVGSKLKGAIYYIRSDKEFFRAKSNY